ncbi:MAG: hypothetical protein D3910_12395, partial [Candidatus Electrothrix sp. ATG2]|nr:hypothetical protein [Candidatus Electrothrix sp. ATG2]
MEHLESIRCRDEQPWRFLGRNQRKIQPETLSHALYGQNVFLTCFQTERTTNRADTKKNCTLFL